MTTTLLQDHESSASKGPCPSREDFFKAVRKEPRLSSWGLADRNVCRRNNISPERFKADREDLQANGYEMFVLCCKYLSLCVRQPRVNRKMGTSYGLKHCVENWSGKYVTNGSFIAAVIFMEVKFEWIEGTPNVLVGIKAPLPVGSYFQRHLMSAERSR